MKIGDIVYHRRTGQRLTVKQTARGDGFVLCCWMGTDTIGKPMELSSAFDWKELTTVKPEIPGKNYVALDIKGEMLSKEPADNVLTVEDQQSIDELTKSMSDLTKQTESALATAETQQQTKRRK